MASQPLFVRPTSDTIGVSLGPEMLIPLASGVAYAAPGAFLAWLQRARKDEACIYARTTMLSRREPIGATVQLISDAGQVTLCQSRPHALFPYHYIARRTAKPLTIAPLRLGSGQASPSRVRAMLSEAQTIVLDHLTELAETGRGHGSNSHIALRLGLGSREAVANALTGLDRLGLIRRSQDDAFRRVIEIVETGCKTRRLP